MWNVIIGGIVTLAVTTVVQLLIIPHVQARTRGRERWEKDMITLAALVEAEIPRALDDYQFAQASIRWARGPAEDEEADPAHVDRVLEQAETEAREARRLIDEHMASLMRLVGHARRVNPNAAYWRGLSMNSSKLRMACYRVQTVDAYRVDSSTLELDNPPLVSDDEFRKTWESVDAARAQLWQTVNELVGPVPMKPPPHERRLGVKSLMWAARKFRRKNRNGEVLALPKAAIGP